MFAILGLLFDSPTHTMYKACYIHGDITKKGRRVPKGASSKTRRLNGERKKWVPNNANEM